MPLSPLLMPRTIKPPHNPMKPKRKRIIHAIRLIRPTRKVQLKVTLPIIRA